MYFTDCKCNERGSVSKSCDNNTGRCTCKPNIVGAKCDQCDEGYYGWSWPDCERKYLLFFLEILVIYFENYKKLLLFICRDTKWRLP